MPVKLNTDKFTLTDAHIELLESEDGHIPVQGLNGEECLVCIAMNELRGRRAQLAIAEKVVQAMRRLVEAMGDLSTARLTEGIPLELASQIGVHHLEAYAALAEYDKERAAP